MSRRELDRKRLLDRVIDRVMRQKDVAEELKVSERHVRRLMRWYREHGPPGLISRRRGKPSNRKIAAEVKCRAITLVREHYYDFRPTLANEKLSDIYQIKVSAAENIFYFYLIAEIVLKFIPLNQRDNRIYKLLLAILCGRENKLAMDWLLLYFLVWFLRSEGLLFNPGRCSNCSTAGLTRAWVRNDYRGLLCSRCKTNERLILSQEELAYMNWTTNHHPQDSGLWTGRFLPAPMIRLLVGKIEYHGEFALQSSRYLPEFR